MLAVIALLGCEAPRSEAGGLEGQFLPDLASFTAGDTEFTVQTTSVGRDGEGVFDDGGEWWERRAEGFEQGWQLGSRLAGEGPVSIGVVIDGARAVASDSRVALVDDTGPFATIGRLSASDADGRPLPAWFEPSEDGVRVRVDDAGASYPIDIDPVVSTFAWSALGSSASGYYGGVVDGADLDEDGFSDLLVAAFDHASGAGALWMYRGSASGAAATPTAVLNGGPNDQLGFAVAHGDLNGDGHVDLVVSARGYASRTGSVRVYYGAGAGLPTTPDLTLYGEAIGSDYGSSVVANFDVNGDGYDDLAVASSGYASYTGRAYVYMGSAGGLSATPARTWTGSAANARYSADLNSAGDVNGDGYDDLGISSPTQLQGSQAFVYAGSAAGLAATPMTTFVNDTQGWRPDQIQGVGDVNGDGYGDVLLAYPMYGGRGRADLHLGSATGVSTAIFWSGQGASSFTGAYGQTSAAFDVDHDGYSDVIVSEPGRSRVHIMPGSPTGLIVPQTIVNTSTNTFGMGMAVAGDVDGDGYDDLLLGAYSANSYTGAAYLYMGYADRDADGSAATVDCDDVDPSRYPGAPEKCNGTDDDCDLVIDEGVQTTYYLDADVDGYGGAAVHSDACKAPAGYVTTASDCDDADASVHPGASEVTFNGRDDDCSSKTADQPDADGDGSPDNVDCDDVDASIHPGAPETCDGKDDDCDVAIDEGVGDIWYLDADHDDHGTSVTSQQACSQPAGYVAEPGDCDDANATVYANAVEILNDGVDNDCNLATPDDPDEDGDGFPLSQDCDDADDQRSPDAAEACNGVDDDCDGDVDEDGATVWYGDSDGDGAGAASYAIEACEAPDGYVESDGDCDDTDPNVHPGAAEACNSADDDCDGAIDDGVTVEVFADADQDGYGDPAVSIQACTMGVGTSLTSTDCNDADPAIHPFADEVPDNDLDDDCDPGTSDASLKYWCSSAPTPGYGSALGLVLAALVLRRRADLAGLDVAKARAPRPCHRGRPVGLGHALDGPQRDGRVH